jgi:hypothetical protein
VVTTDCRPRFIHGNAPRRKSKFYAAPNGKQMAALSQEEPLSAGCARGYDDLDHGRDHGVGVGALDRVL